MSEGFWAHHQVWVSAWLFPSAALTQANSLASEFPSYMTGLHERMEMNEFYKL